MVAGRHAGVYFHWLITVALRQLLSRNISRCFFLKHFSFFSGSRALIKLMADGRPGAETLLSFASEYFDIFAIISQKIISVPTFCQSHWHLSFRRCHPDWLPKYFDEMRRAWCQPWRGRLSGSECVRADYRWLSDFTIFISPRISFCEMPIRRCRLIKAISSDGFRQQYLRRWRQRWENIFIVGFRLMSWWHGCCRIHANID